jgi:hypothetical protein
MQRGFTTAVGVAVRRAHIAVQIFPAAGVVLWLVSAAQRRRKPLDNVPSRISVPAKSTPLAVGESTFINNNIASAREITRKMPTALLPFIRASLLFGSPDFHSDESFFN